VPIPAIINQSESATARIDLNAAPKELLVGLFAELGAHQGNAENYANRIAGWRNAPPPGEDSEASAYQKAGLRYAPRGAPFPHVNELSLVLDLPIALVERALPFVTVYSGLPQVNALAAAPEVLAALPGMTRDRLNAFLVQRQATPGNGQVLTSLLGPSRGYATLDRGKATRVTVRIAVDNGRRIGSEVVILVFDAGTEPFSVLSWRDELDEPHPDNQPKRGVR
jgi:general secretion pathway protein K